jgi:hypothetical protein
MTYFKYFCEYIVEDMEKRKKRIIQDNRAAASDSNLGPRECETEILITTNWA